MGACPHEEKGEGEKLFYDLVSSVVRCIGFHCAVTMEFIRSEGECH